MDESGDPLVLAAPEPEDTRYFIHSTASMVERRPRILKHGDTFGMFNPFGDILPDLAMAEGLYHRDTRHLSGFQLRVAGRTPLLLSSTVLLNNAVLKADLTNPDIANGDGRRLPRDLLHISRAKYLWQGCANERIAVRNFAADTVAVDLDLVFDADFADIFEARGFPGRSRHVAKAVEPAAGRVTLSCEGGDGRTRRTVVSLDRVPDHLTVDKARYHLTLAPGETVSLFAVVTCDGPSPCSRPALGFFHGLKQARRPIRQVASRSTAVETSNIMVNATLCRGMADLTMLLTETPHGPYPYAGVPWFSTAFGRDGLITALLMLWVDPEMARGVLRVLAATQARGDDPASDAEPGKILHETRDGELSRMGVVPFRHYYGTIDATPLFVVLAGAYYERTGDLDTIRALDPHLRAALDWIARHGDRDGDGLVEYGRRRSDGLLNQGWKDSNDSVFHASGALAAAPISLVEVQGYCYAAWRAASRLAEALGHSAEAAERAKRAEAVRAAVEDRFWLHSQEFYALALDGDKQPCAVRASNAGHLLFSGLPTAERAARVVDALVSPAFFTGFGVRTLAGGEVRYNPMSYHNGSVWPHDTALIALGMARYGHKAPVLRLFQGLFDAAGFMDLRRLPEVFCGVRRQPESGPVLYPVACSPQAWASAAPFGLLQAILGLQFDGPRRTLRFDRPSLPPDLDEVRLSNLTLGSGAVDVVVRRADGGVAVNVVGRRGERITVTVCL